MTEVFFFGFFNDPLQACKYIEMFAIFKNFTVKYCVNVFGTKTINTIVQRVARCNRNFQSFY